MTSLEDHVHSQRCRPATKSSSALSASRHQLKLQTGLLCHLGMYPMEYVCGRSVFSISILEDIVRVVNIPAT